MLKSYRTILLLCCITICIPHITFAQEKQREEIEAYIRKANQSGLFNGNILVIDENKVVYKAAIGFADTSKKIPLTEQYRFHIGSIAKEFDAVGIMVLKEQGKLKLDDKLSVFFPELPAWAEKISVKNLLQYTSGLPDINYTKDDAGNWKDLQTLQQLNFEPGSSYAYNNNNTFLRRKIIEKVSGMRIKDFIEQQLLKPNGISHGIVDPADDEPLIAKSFNDKLKQDAFVYPITGWTCLTLDDFSKWASCIENFSIISPASTHEIISPAGKDEQSGLGTGKMRGDRVIRHVHDGIAMRYQALEVTDGPKKRTIILMTNNRHDNVYEINTAIEAILDGKPYQQAGTSR